MRRIYDLLFPYQRRIVLDRSRFKLLNCSRQCGKSTVFAVESVLSCVARPKDKWVALSRGERQVKEWILKAAEWAEKAVLLANAKGLPLKYKANATEILFSNGSRIIGIPANADTARGYSANVILDEFAYHEHAEEIWAAVFPYITNEINNQFVLRVGSTVNGRNNKFWQLFAERDSLFRKYRVTVEDAVAEGMPINIPMLKKAIADPDIWQQEYLCIPVEGATTLLSYDLIHAAQSHEASIESPYEFLDTPGRVFYAGIDIGRKHDRTVIWVCEVFGSRIITRFVRVMRHAEFERQRQVIFSFLERNGVKRVFIDATGIGAQLAETAQKAFPHKVEPVQVTAAVKNEIFLGMQRDFQGGSVEIPYDSEDLEISLEEDLHNVQRVFTSSGNVLYYSPHNADGHSDGAFALALCLHAIRENAMRSLGADAGQTFSSRNIPAFMSESDGIPSIYGAKFI